MPAKAGIQQGFDALDSRFRNDKLKERRPSAPRQA
jgi:hypothetical protein